VEMEAAVVCLGGGLVAELRLLLHNVTLQVDKDDRWLWNLETTHVFFPFVVLIIGSLFNLLLLLQWLGCVS